MQYILSEEEYNNLITNANIRKKEDQDIINKLCQMVADYKPVKVYWNKESLEPWGCWHSREEHEWYCDECPVKKECGLPKNYSK
jgi:hypothetical protein